MKFDTPKPCTSCPYRRDAELGFWHPSEFQKLLEQDADELNGNLFACHGTRKLEEQSICAGWFLDQQRRGYPSIRLRLVLAKNKEALKYEKQVNADGLVLYDSIKEMCLANIGVPRKRKKCSNSLKKKSKT